MTEPDPEFMRRWNGIERRVLTIDEQNRRRRADDPADERLIWAEKHLAPIFRGELKTFGEGIVTAVEAALAKSNGPLVARVDALEKVGAERDGKTIQRSVGWSALVSFIVTLATISIGKIKGWWL